MEEGIENTKKRRLNTFIEHKYVSLFVTSLLAIISIYISLVAVLDISIVHPLSNAVQYNSSLDEEPIEAVYSIMSLFFLTIISLCFGKLLEFCLLPPLFGALVVGLFFRNVPFFDTIFYVHLSFDFVLRKLALVILIVRWGVGLNFRTLKTNPIQPTIQGIVTPLAEVLVIVVAAVFIFGVSLSMAVIGGFLMAAVSPAVTVPVMLDLKIRGIGTEKGIPDAILAASTVDNFLCITLFSVIPAVVFSQGSLALTIVLAVVEVILSAFVGNSLGCILWSFPGKQEPYAHMARGLLLGFISTALVMGMARLNLEFCGLIASLIMCCCAGYGWQTDNIKEVRPVAAAYSYIWNLVAMPILFTLIGMKLDLSKLTWPLFLVSTALILIGTIGRMVSSFLLSCVSNLNFKEQFIVALSLVPKATIQAAFAPTILAMGIDYPEYMEDAELFFVASIITIIATAPTIQFILSFVAPVFLIPSSSIVVDSVEEDHKPMRTTSIRPPVRMNDPDPESIIVPTVIPRLE